MTKSSIAPASVIMTALALAAFGAPRAMASDESGDTSIEIKAPVTATACTAVPPTVTVLGLNIDVTGASFDDQGDDSGPGDDDPPSTPGTCADLVTGASAEVKLASDALPLEATEVDAQGEDDEPSVQAPLQAFDATAKTVTVLGLTIDASQASFEGSDDEDDDSPSLPIDLSQLIVGQFVEVHLDPAALPALVATSIDVKNFSNQITVTVVDDNGDEVSDDDATIEVEVEDTVKVSNGTKNALGGEPASQARRSRVVRLQLSSSGSFVLSGLPTGKAKIRAVRTLDTLTQAGKSNVKIRPNATSQVKLRLHKTKTK